jgi:hypothetical protein
MICIPWIMSNMLKLCGVHDDLMVRVSSSLLDLIDSLVSPMKRDFVIA